MLTDTDYADLILRTAEQAGDRVRLSFADGRCLEIPGTYVPEAGARIRVYPRNYWGATIRGVAELLPGEEPQPRYVFFYRTKDEDEAHREGERTKAAIERAREFKEKEPTYRQKIAALPPNFQDRLARFAEHGGPDWELKFLPYELFVCEQAVVISALFADPLFDIKRFIQMGWDEQVALCPGLDDDHSGNTFSAAVHLAQVQHTRPEFVPFSHAAIHTLVGCEAAGCWATRRERTGEELPTNTTEKP